MGPAQHWAGAIGYMPCLSCIVTRWPSHSVWSRCWVGVRDFAGSIGTHSAGVLGGAIWGVGMSFNLIASGRAGLALIVLARTL